MRYLIISFFAGILLCSCSTGEPVEIIVRASSIDWKLEREFVIRNPNNDNVPLFMRTIKENGEDLLVFFNDENKTIYKFDLITLQKRDTIPVNILSENEVWSVYYHNKDTVFVAYNASQNPGYNHTSTIFQINGSGKVTKNISLKGLPVICDECKSVSREDLEYIAMKYGNLFYKDNKLFIQLETYYSNPGDTAYVSRKHGISAHLDLLKDTSYIHGLYLNSGLNAKYPKRYEVVSVCLNENGNPVVSLNYTSSLKEIDVKSGKVLSHKIRSGFGDTLYPYNDSLYKVKPQDDLTQVSMERIFFNPFDNRYYRFTRLPVSDISSIEQKRNPRYGLTVLDKDFVVLCEDTLPADLAPLICFHNGNVLFWKSKGNPEGSNLVYFREYNLNSSGRSLNYSLAKGGKGDKSHDELVSAYVKENVRLTSGKNVIYFIPLEHSCSSCTDEMTDFFCENFKKDYVVLLSSGSEKKINEYEDKFKPLLKDFTVHELKESYRKYLEPPTLNSYVWFFENGELKKEIKIDTENIVQSKEQITGFLTGH